MPNAAPPLDTWPFGPIVALARTSSWGISASASAHNTRCVFIDVGRPHTLIMPLLLQSALAYLRHNIRLPPGTQVRADFDRFWSAVGVLGTARTLSAPCGRRALGPGWRNTRSGGYQGGP